MIMNMYSIKDAKSDFGAPVPIQDNEMAKRWFDNQVKTTPFLNNYPEDFALYNLGTFDTETGKIEPIPFPEEIMHALEVKHYGKNNAIPDND